MAIYGPTPDASTSSKGKIMLSGDLAGTADAPTVKTHQIVTSGTRPGAPSDGWLIYETDTKENLQYYSAAAVWRRPWNMPWGVVGKASNASSTQAISAEADVTGLTTTITAVANRIYKVSAKVSGTASQGTLNQVRIFADGSAVDGPWGSKEHEPGVWYTTMTPIAYITGLAAGSRIIKLRAATTYGTWTLNFDTMTAYLLVEDIGPANATPA